MDSDNGGKGVGRKGDSLEVEVKAGSSEMGIGTHLGLSRPMREAAVVDIRRAGALALRPPASLRENKIGLGSWHAEAKATGGHRGHCTTARGRASNGPWEWLMGP